MGTDIARQLASAGASLCLTYNATPADSLAAELSKEFGVVAKAYQMAEGSEAINACVEKVTKEMGEIDIVIANAGICIHQDAQVSRESLYGVLLECITIARS